MSQITQAQWWWLAHLVVGGTLVPHVAWFVALRYLSANETAVTTYLVPLYATIFSVLILNEQLTAIGLAGGALILTGVTLSQQRRRPRSSVSTEPARARSSMVDASASRKE